MIANNVRDNSGIDPTVTYDPPEVVLTSADIGTNQIVTVTVEDAAGNTQSCRFMIKVEGKYRISSYSHPSI